MALRLAGVSAASATYAIFCPGGYRHDVAQPPER